MTWHKFCENHCGRILTLAQYERGLCEKCFEEKKKHAEEIEEKHRLKEED